MCDLKTLIFSSKIFLEEFVLRCLKASPLLKPFFTPGGWDEVKCAYWNVSVGLKCVRTSRTESFRNFSPLEIAVSRNVVFVSDQVYFSREFYCWVVTVGLFNELWYFYSVIVQSTPFYVVGSGGNFFASIAELKFNCSELLKKLLDGGNHQINISH